VSLNEVRYRPGEVRWFWVGLSVVELGFSKVGWGWLRLGEAGQGHVRLGVGEA
jgi:hypothetical protein